MFTANADMMLFILDMPNYDKSTGATVSQYTVNFCMFHTIQLFSNSACMCYSFPLLKLFESPCLSLSNVGSACILMVAVVSLFQVFFLKKRTQWKARKS
jgi:hypothetical protein